MARISGLACFFLVALRLVIGWHFLVEGVHKIRTHQIGKTSTNAPWTGEPFFREGYGPAAEWYRQVLGISDATALAKLRDRVGNEPAIVARDWRDFLTRAERHYEFMADQRQRAETAFKENVSTLTDWLDGRTATTVAKPVAWGTAEVPATVPALLAEYDAKLREMREIEDEQAEFNQSVNAVRTRALKADAARILNGLVAELDVRTAAMKKAVIEAANLTPAQEAKGLPPESAPAARPIDKLDRITMWLQAICGGFLLVGLLSRLSAALLAGFLVQVVIITPALPWAPTPPGSTGHYLFIDMHVIEMVALLALAALPTGRWFGLDALLGRPAPRPRNPKLG